MTKTKIGFHRTHPRVQFTGLVLDRKTGEFKTPKVRTKQSFVAECDINNILKQYKRTGQLAHVTANQAKYQDLPDPIEFQDSMNMVIQAEQAFASLPSKIRNRFQNDPTEFLEFMSDPANQDEAIKMGLATDNRPPPAPEIPPPAVKPDEPPAGGS